MSRLFSCPAIDCDRRSAHAVHFASPCRSQSVSDSTLPLCSRDQRLWIGDLRLQALASYATFKDYALVKRCLYLYAAPDFSPLLRSICPRYSFAAMPFNDDGLLCACAYEEPEPHTGGNSIVDYALLFTNTLVDYIEGCGDKAAGEELYEIARKQFDLALRRVGADFLYDVPVPKDLLGGGDWHFIDCE